MRFHARQGWSAIALLYLIALPLSGCVIAMLKPYDEGISPQERLKECRLLDRKVTEAGQLNAVGVFLAGGAGLAAGVTDDNSELLGIVSGLFGLFAAWAGWANTRHSERFDDRHCDFILNADTTDSSFRRRIRELENLPPLDSVLGKSTTPVDSAK
jgi:hypothetical protein